MQHVLYKHSSQGPLQKYQSSQHHHQQFQLKKKNPRRSKLLYAARAEGKDYPETEHLMGARTELTLCNYSCWTLTDSCT